MVVQGCGAIRWQLCLRESEGGTLLLENVYVSLEGGGGKVFMGIDVIGGCDSVQTFPPL